MSNYQDDGRNDLEGSDVYDKLMAAHKSENKYFWISDIDQAMFAKNPERVVGIVEAKCKRTELYPNGISDINDKGAFSFVQSGVIRQFYLANFPCYAVFYNHDKASGVFYDFDVWRVTAIEPIEPRWEGKKLLSHGTWRDYIATEGKIREESRRNPFSWTIEMSRKMGFILKELPPPKGLLITVTITKPHAWLLKSVINFLSIPNGQDRFRLIVEGQVVDYPNHRTTYSKLLMSDIAKLIEDDNGVSVQPYNDSVSASPPLIVTPSSTIKDKITGARLGMLDLPVSSHYAKT